MKKDYKRIYIIIGTVLGVALLVGASYALLNVTTRGEKTNIINAGKLSVEITDEANEIYQINPLPLTDEEALRTTPYSFNVTNTGTIDADYYLTLDVVELTFNKTNIKYYLTKNVNGEEIVVKDVTLLNYGFTTTIGGKELYALDNGRIKVGESYSYNLYMWVDYNTTADDAEQSTCKAKVRVDSVSITKTPSGTLRKPTEQEKSEFDHYDWGNCVAEGDYSQPKYNSIYYSDSPGFISANILNPSIPGINAGVYLYFFENYDYGDLHFLGNKWYYTEDDSNYVEYNGVCPFVKTDFRSHWIYSESYLEAIMSSFS